MNARAIIEAIDPKRVLRQLRQAGQGQMTLGDWARANFKPHSPTQFYYDARTVGNLRCKIWVTLYTSSVWYRCVLLRGVVAAAPVYKMWEINPRRAGDWAGESADDSALVPVLDRLTSEIKQALNVPQEEGSLYRQRTLLKDKIGAAFQEAERILRGLPNR